MKVGSKKVMVCILNEEGRTTETIGQFDSEDAAKMWTYCMLDGEYSYKIVPLIPMKTWENTRSK